MFRLFRKRKHVASGLLQSRLTQWYTGRLIRLQKQWSNRMQRIMGKLSPLGQKFMVITSCIVCVGYCSWLIYQSFNQKHTALFSVTSIQAPAHITKTGEEKIPGNTIITKEAYQQIRKFHLYFDSLNVTSSGSKKADSLLSLRPGLMDSIYRFEQLYQLQQSKMK